MDVTSYMIPTGLIVLFGALVLSFFQGRLFQMIALSVPVLALVGVWLIPQDGGVSLPLSIAGVKANLLHVHAYSNIFATAFIIALGMGCVFALPRMSKTEIVAAFLYAGSAISVLFAGDLMTLFIFWEIMALGSTVVIWSAGTEGSKRAGLRYVMMHFLGGVILLVGIMAVKAVQGDFEIVARSLQWSDVTNWQEMSLLTVGSLLMLVGVLVNAAAPPFSSWLSDAYPEASYSGMVFLSAFTTKTAVFVLLLLFPGTSLLIPIGSVMIFYGIIYAILENDMRRILAYSIINQVGFMVVGAGIGTTMALHGAAAHAFCHIIYKALLLMSAGAVLYQTGKSRCSDLGGLYHTMKLTMVCGVVGALAISAFPLTSGFVSKSMISQAAADQQLFYVWLGLVAASAGVFLHAGIKFPWFVFFQKDSGLRPSEAPLPMQCAMVVMALLCIVPGVMPQWLYAMLPSEITYKAYTGAHVITQLQLLLFSGLAFFVMLPLLKRTETISLDWDWFYRIPGRRAGLLGLQIMRDISNFLLASAVAMWQLYVHHGRRLCSYHGVLGGARSTSMSIAVMLILLCIYALLHYLL